MKPDQVTKNVTLKSHFEIKFYQYNTKNVRHLDPLLLCAYFFFFLELVPSEVEAAEGASCAGAHFKGYRR